MHVAMYVCDEYACMRLMGVSNMWHMNMHVYHQLYFHMEQDFIFRLTKLFLGSKILDCFHSRRID